MRSLAMLFVALVLFAWGPTASADSVRVRWYRNGQMRRYHWREPFDQANFSALMGLGSDVLKAVPSFIGREGGSGDSGNGNDDGEDDAGLKVQGDGAGGSSSDLDSLKTRVKALEDRIDASIKGIETRMMNHLIENPSVRIEHTAKLHFASVGTVVSKVKELRDEAERSVKLGKSLLRDLNDHPALKARDEKGAVEIDRVTREVEQLLGNLKATDFYKGVAAAEKVE